MYFCLSHRWADATDPRDKLYSQFSLVNNMMEQKAGHTLQTSSYSTELTHQHIYQQIMRSLVEETDSLAVLLAVNDPSPLRTSFLPSWAPDLSRQQGLD